MSESSGIEWCDSTFNPWVGCTKISPACDHCYAEGWAKRSGLVKWGNEPRRRTSESNWREPLKWQATAEQFEREHGHRRRVFCASLADVFDNQVPMEWRNDLWSLIERCWGLDWLLLTKRPQNIEKMLPDAPTWENIRGHVWLGTTVEDQQRAGQNIPHLLKHDSAVRFLSCEPLLGPISLANMRYGKVVLNPLLGMSEGPSDAIRALLGHDAFMPIDWVIAGGESGPHARPSHPDWFRSLRDQCAAAGVPFLFKQWGEWAPHTPVAGGDLGGEVRRGKATIVHPTGQSDVEVFNATGRNTIKGSRYMARIGKKSAGRLLDGIEHNGFPNIDHARAAA